MSEMRFCLDCNTLGKINSHGDCGTCGSSAVALPESIYQWQAKKARDVAELEKIYRFPQTKVLTPRK